MTIADSILVFTFLIAAVMASGAAFYLKQPLVWLIAAVMWALSAINGLRLTASPWDAMAFLFFMSIGLMIASALMALQTRRMQREEDKGSQVPGDDIDNYTKEVSSYGEQQKRVSAATGGRRVKRRGI